MMIQAAYYGTQPISRIYIDGRIIWEANTAIPVYAAGVGIAHLHGTAAADSAAAVCLRLSAPVTAESAADGTLYEVPQIRLWSADALRGNALPVTETTVRAILCALVDDIHSDAAGSAHETAPVRMHTKSILAGAAGGRTYGIVYTSGTGTEVLHSAAGGQETPSIHAGGISSHKIDAGGSASAESHEVADVRLLGATVGGGSADPMAHSIKAVLLFGTGGVRPSLAGAEAEMDEGYVYPILLKIADGDFPVSLLLETGEEYPLENISEPVLTDDEYILEIT